MNLKINDQQIGSVHGIEMHSFHADSVFRITYFSCVRGVVVQHKVSSCFVFDIEVLSSASHLNLAAERTRTGTATPHYPAGMATCPVERRTFKCRLFSFLTRVVCFVMIFVHSNRGGLRTQGIYYDIKFLNILYASFSLDHPNHRAHLLFVMKWWHTTLNHRYLTTYPVTLNYVFGCFAKHRKPAIQK